MDAIAVRALSQLPYEDPRALLRAAWPSTAAFASGELAPGIRSLRAAEGKPARERREAAMFCHLLGQRLGVSVLMATKEAQDFDFVASWPVENEHAFIPVQLKELPPAEANATSALEQLLEGLAKYKDSRDTLFAVHLNRRLTVDPMEVPVPANLVIGGLWYFGAIAQDLRTWGLWGDFLSNPSGTAHAYPDA